MGDLCKLSELIRKNDQIHLILRALISAPIFCLVPLWKICSSSKFCTGIQCPCRWFRCRIGLRADCKIWTVKIRNWGVFSLKLPSLIVGIFFDFMGGIKVVAKVSQPLGEGKKKKKWIENVKFYLMKFTRNFFLERIATSRGILSQPRNCNFSLAEEFS